MQGARDAPKTFRRDGVAHSAFGGFSVPRGGGDGWRGRGPGSRGLVPSVSPCPPVGVARGKVVCYEVVPLALGNTRALATHLARCCAQCAARTLLLAAAPMPEGWVARGRNAAVLHDAALAAVSPRGPMPLRPAEPSPTGLREEHRANSCPC